MSRSLFYSSISAGSALLMLLLLVLAGREWGVDGLGPFSYAIGLATIAEVFMDFGLHQVTIRTVARDTTQAGRLLHTSIALKAAPGLAMILLFGLGATLLRADPIVRAACWLMLGSAAMRSYLLTARGVLQGLERFGDDALITVGDRLLLLVACGTALWLHAGVITVCLVFLVVRAFTAAAALLLAKLRAGHGAIDRELWRRLPGEAVPLGLFLLVLNVYNRVDTVMLGSMAGDPNRSTGLYGAAYQLYEGSTYPAAIVAAVLIPRLSRLIGNQTAEYRHLVRTGLAGVLAVALIVLAVGWPLVGWGIRLTYGGEFDMASHTLRILLAGLPAVYATWVLHAVAMSAHRNKQLLWATGIGTAFNIALNSLLIPRYAHDGAALATVASEYVVTAMLWIGLRPAWNLRAVKSTGAADPVGSSPGRQ
ncbi:MAG: flippase [Vicinamibacterales bacterium]